VTILEIRGLQTFYGPVPVLRGIDLKVEQGEFVGVIGLSGSGKSTLLRSINRLIAVDGGSIVVPASLLDGRNGATVDILKLSNTELRHVRRRIGMIFQEFALVERLSVMENALSGRLGYVGFWASWIRRFPADDIQKAFAVLDRVGLMDHVDKRADALSGGQRQRVGIARALIQEPDLLLVDEPTASLDPKTSRQVMRLLIEVCTERGLATIVNIHDVGLAQMFLPRIVGLRAGEVVYDGPTAGLTADVLTRIYGEEDWTQTAAADDDRDTAADLVSETERRIAGAA